MNRIAVLSAAALSAAVFFLACTPASAFDLHRARAQDLSPKLQDSLTDKASEDAGPYLDKEEEKKGQGKVYVDLQKKFEYLPTRGPGGSLSCSVKLGGPEYDPTKKTTTKGDPTGNLKYLVFSYAYDNGRWVAMSKPKWETQNLGAAGRAQMTKGMQIGEHNDAIREKWAKKRAAAAAAAAAAQKAAGNH